ncbi:benzyl alcohol O-benzoyltransferase-like [Curcuma longa]|uniref:benzyl alcohol O-benzoyltransferase-like n=1 Tax=Curcuma longa TaxID=136217 RepID=UPI003D9E692B
MEAPRALSFTVQRRRPVLVAPSVPTPYQFKRLSDIDDQDGLRTQIPIIQYYRNSGDDRDPVKLLRDALARALVFYYPLAGRLREVAGRKLVVECTGEGILFVEADADVRLEQLDDALHPPIPYLDELLHDVLGSGGILHCPLMLMQVTRLKCGGFIVALRTNHTMADGAGLGQFLNAVAELACGASAPSVLPVWERHLLKSRSPPRITCVHLEYEQLKPPQIPRSIPNDDMVHQSFFFVKGDIDLLRRSVPAHLRDGSPFEILTAFLWRCRTRAISPAAGDVVRVCFSVNARGRRCAGLGLPPGYYGNAIAFPVAAASGGDLCSRPLCYALELIRAAKAAVTAEYMRSVADLLVLRGRPHYQVAGTYLVSDGTRSGVDEVDYGWGKPVYGGPAWGRVASIHLPFTNSRGQEGIVVPHYLPRSTMDRFFIEVDRVIKEKTSARSSL